MVGIVIVSHSAKLAAGIRELAQQMVQEEVPLAVAGGIDDPENPIGTDPMLVQQAIESVYSDDGVLVLMDLGSALLSAEVAVEFLPPEQQQNVHLISAPVVEGALAAVVQASVGGTLAQVKAEAQGALAVKANHLGEEAAQDAAELEAVGGETRTLTVTVQNKLGLHARPAARFVSTANQFAADIRVSKGEQSANAKSINQVATLGVRQGDAIRITAVGPDVGAALTAFSDLAAQNFGDVDGEDEKAAPVVTQQPSAAEGELTGIAASPGIAIGPAFLYRPQLPPVEATTIADAAAEWTRLKTAVNAALVELAQVRANAERRVGAEEAAIFDAHRLFLQDPDLQQKAKSAIESQQMNAAAAWLGAIEETAAAFRALDDPYMQARAADVEDVGNRVLRHLLGVAPPTLALAQPSIVVARDLSPSDTARLDRDQVLGICTELGGATSHSTILARALGIPAIVGVGAQLGAIDDGQMIALDGAAGRLWPAPDETRLAQLQAQRDAWQQQQTAAKAAGSEPAVTVDGQRIEVAANIGGPKDTAVALEYGAEGVGLFRTEFLFLDRESAPDEAEQVEAYRQVVAAMGERPLIIRTLDVGGDKPLPYLDLGEEENPFLGWRGIRFCLDMPHIFKPQLRAILRASANGDGEPHNVKIMFPMVGSLQEVRRAKMLLEEVKQELRAEGFPFSPDIEVGVMIEVPSAVAIADQLAREVHFFSIGTNDLTQYVMAADRGNASVAELAQALQPAVLRLVKQTVDAAHAAGIWVGMCGELAGNPLATPLLIGLGLDELSMSAPSIPAVKSAVRAVTIADARQFAEKVLQLESANDVIEYLEKLVIE